MASYENGGGGAGGKFKKRPFRKPTTPYDRPSTSLRPTQILNNNNSNNNNTNNNNNGWLSKIVDPASKLLTAGAHKLFSSVFRKRLLPPPPRHHQHGDHQGDHQGDRHEQLAEEGEEGQGQLSPCLDEREESGFIQPEAARNAITSATRKPIVCGGKNSSRTSDINRVAELEDILKQKTFTRSELDHLTALLLSRTVDDSLGAQKGSSEAKVLDLQPVQHSSEKLSNFLAHENGIKHGLPAVSFSTPETRTKVLEDDAASPAEIAKAYMGSRPTIASPLVLSMQNRRPKEDFKLRSPAISLSQKPASETGTSTNGFMTPRFRGRSAIYSMARTPYSRVPTSVKAAETSLIGGVGSSSSHKTTENDQLNGSKRQVLKRRSSVMENDIGSVGPIRRIRQKPNLLHPKTLSLPPPRIRQATHVSGALSDVAELSPSMKWRPENRSLLEMPGENSLPSTSSAHVPIHSIETAQKIFRELDKCISKGKSPEKKIDLGLGNSTTEMAPEMLTGLARKSVEAKSSSNVMQITSDIRKGNGSLDSVSAHNSSPTTSPMVEEGSGKKLVISSNNVAPPNGAEIRNTVSHSSHKSKAADYVVPLSSFELPRKKRAFQMSAHEDYLDLDDDVPSNGEVTSNSLIKGRERAELSSKVPSVPDNFTRNETIEKPPASVFETSASVCLSKEPESLSNGTAAANSKAISFSSVVSLCPPATSMTMPVSAPQTTSESEIAAPHDGKTKTNSVFDSKSDELPPISFATSPAVVASVFAKETKFDSSSSPKDAAVNVNGPDKTVGGSTQLIADAMKESGDSTSAVISAKPFSFGLSGNSAVSSNALFSTLSAASSAPSPVQFSSSSNYQSSIPVSMSSLPMLSGGLTSSNGSVEPNPVSFTAFAGTMISTATTTTSINALSACSGPLSSSVTSPLLSSGSLSGLTAVPSTSVTVATSASVSTTNSGAKLNDTSTPNTASRPLSEELSAAAGNANNSGALDSTMKSASGGAQTAVSGLAFSFQATSSSASLSTSVPSFPGQSASSVPSPVSTFTPSFSSQSAPSFSASVLSMSGPASFSTGGLGLGSFTSSASPFSSGHSTAGSCLTSSVSTSSAVAPGIFGSSWQSAKPTTPGSIFGTTSQSTGFSFGSTPSGSSTAANNNPFVFGGAPTMSSVTSSSAFGSTGSAAAPLFSVSSPAVSAASSSSIFQSQPSFGNASAQPFLFSPTLPRNNDQMTMEDSMAEDSVQPPAPAAPVFGAPVSAPSSNFVFGSAAPSTGNPFQFGNQNQLAPQNASPFASGSLEFNAGGTNSFSLGTTGDKSNRRKFKPKKTARR